MDTFGSLDVGEQFKFKGRTYTKISTTLGVAIQSLRQSVRFFTESQMVNII